MFSKDVIVVRIVDGRRVSVCRSNLVEHLWLISCGVREVAEVRWESGLVVTVREQKKRMKHENGEGEM